MKAQDLRIGNIIALPLLGLYDGVIKDKEHVQSKRFVGGTSQHFFENIEKYASIPLTEEWIKKAGARKTHDLLGTYELDRFELYPFYLHDFYKIIDKETKAYITKVSFVHELQNVYFALNGEELPL